MAARRSAGLVLYRRGTGGTVEILLVHPGGPFWAGRDRHAWSIPKGEHAPGDDAVRTAEREFEEELGVPPPAGPRTDLGEVGLPGGKRVRAWAVEGDLDVATVSSNTFELEWPPGSGTVRHFPEVDRAAWFDLEAARWKLHKGQAGLVDALVGILAGGDEPGRGGAC